MGSKVVQVLTAIVGVAIVAVLVSKNAQTQQLITSVGSTFSSIIKAAVAPVSGGTSSIGSSLSSVSSDLGNGLLG